MRIIGGALRGRRLSPVRGKKVRPTLDRVREALFNLLGGECRGWQVLDLYAGTGALGLEALSRGAGFCLFADQDPLALKRIHLDLVRLGLAEQGKLIKVTLPGGIKKIVPPPGGFNLILMDPPYGKGFMGATLKSIQQRALLAPGGKVVVEHRAGEELPAVPGNIKKEDQRQYGTVMLTIYRAGEEGENHG